MGGLKKLLQNKNTVTVLCVVLGIVILYVAYNMRVKSAINPVSVPYALQDISPGTQITSDMVGTRQVPPSMLEGEVLLSKSDVIDKYSNADTVIPKGNVFYKRTVVEKEQLPGNIILEYPKGYVLFNLDATTNSTYGNSVYPGNYIDIWLKAVTKIDENDANAIHSTKANMVMYSKLISNIKVLAVQDSNGDPVFSNLDEEKQPASIIFALPEDMFVLLKKAENMREYNVTIDLVPTNEGSKDDPDGIKLASEQMVEFINKNTVWEENIG